MSKQDKKLYYMAVVRNGVVLCDFTKSHLARGKSNYQLFTNEILPKLGRGEFFMDYKE